MPADKQSSGVWDLGGRSISPSRGATPLTGGRYSSRGGENPFQTGQNRRSDEGMHGGIDPLRMSEMNDRDQLMKSQLRAKHLLMEEQNDEISALKSHCDMLTRALETKDEEASILQQAIEQVNNSHMSALGGQTPQQLQDEIQRLEALLRTSHTQGKRLYDDYQRLQQDHEDRLSYVEEAEDNIQKLQDALQKAIEQKNAIQHQPPPLPVKTPAVEVVQPQVEPPEQHRPSEPPTLLSFSPPHKSKGGPRAPPSLSSRQKTANSAPSSRSSTPTAQKGKHENAELRDLRENMKRATQQLMDYADKLRKLEEENDRLRQEQDTNEASIRTLPVTRRDAPQMDDLVRKNNDLMLELKRLKKRRTTPDTLAESYIKELEDEIEKLKTIDHGRVNPALVARNEDLTRENNKLHAELQALAGGSRRGSITPTMGHVDPHNQKLALANGKVAELLDEISNLQMRRPSHSSQGTDYTPELLDEVNRLRGELASLGQNDERLAAANNRIKELFDENDRIHAENKALNRNLVETPTDGRRASVTPTRSHAVPQDYRLEAADEKIRELLAEIADLQMRRSSHGSRGSDYTPELIDEVTRLRNELASLGQSNARLAAADDKIKELFDKNDILAAENKSLKMPRPRLAADDQIRDVLDDVEKLLLKNPGSRRSSQGEDDTPRLLDEVNRLRNDIAKLPKSSPRNGTKLKELEDENRKLKSQLRSDPSGPRDRLAAADAKIEELLDDIANLKKPSHVPQGIDYTPQLLDEVNRLRGDLAKLSTAGNDPQANARLKELADENSKLKSQLRSALGDTGDKVKELLEDIANLRRPSSKSEDTPKLLDEINKLRGEVTKVANPVVPQDRRLVAADNKIRQLLDDIENMKKPSSGHSTHGPDYTPELLDEVNRLRDELAKLGRPRNDDKKLNVLSDENSRLRAENAALRSGQVPGDDHSRRLAAADDKIRELLDDIANLKARPEYGSQGTDYTPELLDEVNRLRGELARLAPTDARMKDLVDEVNRLRAENQAMIVPAEEQDHRLLMADDKIRELLDEVANLKVKKAKKVYPDELVKENDDLRSEIKKLKNRRSSQPVEQAYDPRVGSADDKIRDLLDEIRKLKASRRPSDSDDKKVVAQNKKLREELTRLMDPYSRVAVDPKLEKYIGELKAENEQLRRNRPGPAGRDQYVRDLEDEIEKLKTIDHGRVNPALVARNEDLTRENNKLHAELQALAGGSRRGSITPTMGHVDPHNQKLALANGKVAELLDEISNLQVRRPSHSSQGTDYTPELLDEVNRLRGELASLGQNDERLAAANNRIKELFDENDRIHAENKALNRKPVGTPTRSHPVPQDHRLEAADDRIRELLHEISDLKMRRPSHSSQGSDNVPELLDEVNRLRRELARLNSPSNVQTVPQDRRVEAADRKIKELLDDIAELKKRRPSHSSQGTDYTELLDEVDRLRGELATFSQNDKGLAKANNRIKELFDENDRIHAENKALRARSTPTQVPQDHRLQAANDRIQDLLAEIADLKRRPSHSSQTSEYIPDLLDEVNRLRKELARFSTPHSRSGRTPSKVHMEDENTLNAEMQTPTRAQDIRLIAADEKIRQLLDENASLKRRPSYGSQGTNQSTPSRGHEAERLAAADDKIRELLNENARLKGTAAKPVKDQREAETLRRENDHLRSLLKKNSQPWPSKHEPLETDEDVRRLLDEVDELRKRLINKNSDPPAHLAEQNRRLADENLHLRNLLRRPENAGSSAQAGKFVDDTVDELHGEVAHLKNLLAGRNSQEVNPALLERNKQLVNENNNLREQLLMQPRPWGSEGMVRTQELAEIEDLKNRLRQNEMSDGQKMKDLELENQMLRNKLIEGPRRSHEEGLQSLIERLQEENAALRNVGPSRSSTYASDVPALLDEISELRGLLEARGDHAPHLTEQNRQLAEENTHLRQMLQNPQRTSSDDFGRVPSVSVNDVNPALLERNRQLVDENNMLRDTLGSPRRSQSVSTRRDSKDLAEIDSLKDKIRRLQNISDGNERMEQMMRDLEGENAMLRNKLLSKTGNEDRIKDLLDEVAALKSDNRYLKGVAMQGGTPKPSKDQSDEVRRLRDENEYLRGLALHHELATKDKDRETSELHDDAKIFMDEITRLRTCLSQTESPGQVKKLRTQHDKLVKEDVEKFTEVEMEELRSKLQNLRKENIELRGVKSPDKLEYKMQRLRDENDFLKKIIERERADGYSQTEQHVGDAQDLHNRVLLYQKEVGDLKEQLNDNKQLATYTKNIQKEFNENLGTLHEECFHLRKQLQRTDSDAPRLTHEERRMFSSELQRMNNKVRDMQDEIARLLDLLDREKMDKTKATILADKIADMSTNTKILQEECTYLRGLLSDQEGHSEQLVKALREEVLQLKDKLKNDDSKRLKAEHRKLTQRLGDVEEENTALKAALQKKRDDDDMKRKAEMEELEERSKELQEDNDYLKDQLTKYLGEADDMRKMVSSLQVANNTLLKKETDPAKLKDLEKKLRKSEETLKTSEDENRYLKEQLHAASPQQEKQAKEIKELQSEIDILIDKLADATNENKYLKEQLMTSPQQKKDLEDLREEIETLDKQLAELKDENAYLKDLTINSDVKPKDDEELKALQEKNDYLKNRLAELDTTGDVRFRRLRYYAGGALTRGSANQLASAYFNKLRQYKKGTPGSKWGLWEKERFDALRKKVANVMLHTKIRNVAYTYYSKLARNRRRVGPQSSTNTDARRLAAILLKQTNKGKLQVSFNALRDHSMTKRREGDNVHWLNVLWKTKQQAALSANLANNSRVMRKYYKKLADHLTEAKKRHLEQKICETLLMQTAKGSLRVSYGKLERYAKLTREYTRRQHLRNRALSVVMQSTLLGVLRYRWKIWKEYRVARRESVLHFRQQKLASRAAAMLLFRTKLGRLRHRYNLWRDKTGGEKKIHDKTTAAHLLLGNTTKGMLRSKMAVWKQYVSESKRKEKEAMRKRQLCRMLFGKSKLFLMRYAYGRLMGYVTAKREEGFYWRQQKIMRRLMEALLNKTNKGLLRNGYSALQDNTRHRAHRRNKRRFAELLLGQTKRGTMRKYYVKLQEHCGRASTDEGEKLRRKREKIRLSRVLSSYSDHGLLRIYYNKLYQHMRRMRKLDAKQLTATALLGSTSKLLVVKGMIRMLAWALHGRRRHTDMLWNSTVAPLRMVIGGKPENIDREASSYGKRRRAMSTVTNTAPVSPLTQSPGPSPYTPPRSTSLLDRRRPAARKRDPPVVL